MLRHYFMKQHGSFMKIQYALQCAAIFCSLNGFAAAPQFLQNYVPVVIVNNTGVDPSQIYFLAHGLDSCGLPCFLVPTGAEGECSYQYPNVAGSPGSADPSISKTLSELPAATGSNIPANSYLIYLPINSSSRGYISLYNPMYLPTAYNPAPTRMVLDILDSSVTTIRDPNYYTLYQDFEFGLVPLETYSGSGTALGSSYGTQLFLNLSWVDYFALPMELQLWSFATHQQLNTSPTSGILSTLSRENVIQNMQTVFANAPKPSSAPMIPPWEYLSVPLYTNPYNGTATGPTLRILAAKNSISLGSGAGFVGGNPSESFFPADYVHNANYGPATPTPTTTFMEAAYTFFTTNSLYSKIIPANPDPNLTGGYTYTVSATGGTNLLFTYTGGTVTPGYPQPVNLQINLQTLTTEQLLSGSVWPFTTDGTTPAPSSQTAFGNELSKMVSALFSTSLFPSTLNTSSGSPFLVTDTGFAALPIPMGKTDVYFNPDPAYPGGYWYNLYDQALHENQINTDAPANNPTYGLGYGYDYDDVLNLAGLIQPVIQDQYGNAEADQPYVVITLGSLTGTPVININQDMYTTKSTGVAGYQTIPYPLQVGPLASGTETEVAFIWYDDTLTQHTTSAPTSGNVTLANLTADETHPFQVQFKYNGVTYLYNINLLRQVTTPSSPSNPYSTIDQTYIDGVVFTLEGTSPNQYLLLAVNSTTPPWPG